MIEVPWSITTPLGPLTFTGRAPEVSLLASEIQPELPQGMSVDACHAVLVRLRQLSPGCAASVEINLETSGSVCGGAETGEGLEAIVWRGSGSVLAVGTEDDEFLGLRLGISAPVAEFRYSSNSLSIHLKQPAYCQEFSLHMVLAWNPEPEPSPSSCWFAVDQRHDHVAARIAA
jgi:hypothetical protein